MNPAQEAAWQRANEIEAGIRRITGGYHLKDLPPDTAGEPRCLHVLEMIFNLRLVVAEGECDSPAGGYGRAWCYSGTGLETLQQIVVQAITWDGSDDTEPTGWVKAIPRAVW